MAKPDLTYSAPDGIWTRFYPETDAGEEAWHVMAAADPQGVVAFLPMQVPGVLAQLRAAGLTVRKAKPHKPMTDAELDALLADLDGLTA
jgi:hypothetical protein